MKKRSQNYKKDEDNSNEGENIFNYLEYKNVNDNNQNCFFNSVTNEILNGYAEKEEDMYEVDPDDLERLNYEIINDNTDITKKDKEFFKLWNQFVSTR